MKKRNLFVAAYFAIGAAVTFTSCSSDDDVMTPNGNPEEETAQTIVLEVSNTNGAQTRAGRPLTSSKAGQDIDKVKIIVCDDENNIVWTKNLENWKKTTSEYEYGRKTTIEIPKDEYKLQTDETYSIYAYGWSNNSDYNWETIENATFGFSDDNKTTPDGTHKFNANQVVKLRNNTVGEETFAGSTTVTKGSDDNGVRASIVLNRQVAGSFAYVTKIPYVSKVENGKTLTGTYLQMVAAQGYEQLALGQFLNEDIANNGTGTTTMYVVSGTGEKKPNQVLYSINLKDWFTKIIDDGKGMIKVTNNWKGQRPSGITEGEPSDYYKQGSVFGGSFVIPFDKVSGKNSLELQLLADDEKTVLRKWEVLLPSGSKQLQNHNLWKWNSNTPAWDENTSAQDDKKSYNVLRNYLYGLGKRGLDKPEEEGGTEPDEPLPLDNKTELTVSVNDNWETIYEMDIE